MPRIDEALAFHPLNIAVLTITDSRTEETDTAGALLRDRLLAAGHLLAAKRILPDERDILVAALKELIADPGIDAVISTGGTGLTGRDITPEAFRSVYEKEIEGFGELFRQISYPKIGTSTMLSRATAGIAGGTLLFALPGSPNACRDGWDEILVWQLDSRHRPCNLVELMPRLQEHLKG